MATRSLRFFMRPNEFAALVWEVARKHDLTVILQRMGKNRHLEIAHVPETVVMSDGKPADWLYLASERPDLSALNVNHLVPPKWGWVSSDVPQEENNVLFMAQLAAKSDWWDEETREVFENPASLTLFAKVAPTFRKRLKRPVWVYNVLGGGAAPYRDIGYTEGAMEWVRHGGELRQRGSANVRYTLEEPQRT